MADINLVPKEAKSQARLDVFSKRLQYFSVAVLIFTAAATLWTLMAFTAAVSEKNNLIDQISGITSKINQFRPQEELLVVAKDKAQTADKIVTARVDVNVFLRKLATLVPAGVAFSDIKVGDSTMAATGKAKSSADIAGLVSSLVSANGAEIISGVTIDSLSSDESGIYSFALSAKVAGAKK